MGENDTVLDNVETTILRAGWLQAIEGLNELLREGSPMMSVIVEAELVALQLLIGKARARLMLSQLPKRETPGG